LGGAAGFRYRQRVRLLGLAAPQRDASAGGAASRRVDRGSLHAQGTQTRADPDSDSAAAEGAPARAGRRRGADLQSGSLTSSAPSRDENSFCKTAMSRREDIVSCIDVTMMDRSAHSALPSPYSKIFPAFWAGAAFTHAAGLGGKRFIDFREPHACVSAFVQQHGSK